MKIKHHLGRFATFFKESSIFVQLAIIALGIGLIAGTATVAAIVSTSNDDAATTNTTANDNGITADTETRPSTSDDKQQTEDAETTTPQASQTTSQSTIVQDTPENGSSGDANQEPQPEAQTPEQPTYADTYPFATDCKNNPVYTSTQTDPYGYTKCYSSSYTAFKVAQLTGTPPRNWGDPRQWLTKADSEGIPRGDTPKLHSVGIQITGGAGWSVWVEAIHDNGTIDISYYNFNNNLSFGTQYNISPSVFSTYIYFSE